MWTESDDARVREFCKTVDVGKLTECPKCGMGSGGSSEMMLAQFCTQKYCPFREWRVAKEAAERPATGDRPRAEELPRIRALLVDYAARLQDVNEKPPGQFLIAAALLQAVELIDLLRPLSAGKQTP